MRFFVPLKNTKNNIFLVNILSNWYYTILSSSSVKFHCNTIPFIDLLLSYFKGKKIVTFNLFQLNILANILH